MRHITRWISALSIKTKLVAGFACVLTILLAVAGIGYWRFLALRVRWAVMSSVSPLWRPAGT